MDPANLLTKWYWIVELARRKLGTVLFSLHHVIDFEWMREAYIRTRKDGATGIDGGTAQDYEANLEANLLGWMSDNQKHIYDTNMRWVGYVIRDNAWNSQSGQWIGPIIDGNILDQRGRPIAWSNRSVTSTMPPLRPMAPMKPMTPMTPMRPMTPMTPMTLMTPLGGWSRSSFGEVFG
jgi:hypothetical protein